MADKVTSPSQKEAWLRVAQGWLSLIRKPKKSALEAFDEQTRERGTGQPDSTEKQ